MSAAAKAKIDLAALRHNLQRVHHFAPNSKVFAVIKSNAYGHGLVEVAKALKDVSGLAVARDDEALALKQKGITTPLLILGGVYDDIGFRRATAHNIAITVHTDPQLELLTSGNNGSNLRAVTVWIKVDTGMHRLGFAPERFDEIYKLLTTHTAATQFVLMTHLANADDTNDKRTTTQLSRLNKISQHYNLPISIANSAGIVAWPKTHADIIRPGIMLYGSSPLLGKSAADLGLKPVMTVSSRVVAIKQLRKGDHVGYGGDWVCPENMPVGVVSIGYGDGYPRHARQGTPVLINDKRVPLIGRVSMDLISVDLREHLQVKHGDPVILWGEGLPADEIALAANTITYQLFCGVARRVEFQYING